MGRKDDDIVERLRDQAQAPALAWLTEAADEVERLRAAGDALASAFEEIPHWPEWFYKVYETWLEVRRPVTKA